MQDEWEDVVFNLTEYRDMGISILSSCDDIQTILDDHIVKTITMKGSSFIKPFETVIKEWEEKILHVQAGREIYLNNKNDNENYLFLFIYIQLYSSFNDSKEKKTKTNNNKQETETRLNINSHINHIKSFRSCLAQPKTELHTELSIFINFVKNFCLRHTINTFIQGDELLS